MIGLQTVWLPVCVAYNLFTALLLWCGEPIRCQNIFQTLGSRSFREEFCCL